MKTIAISMAKGGVGKSVTALNLSVALSNAGKKILLVDCDSQQGNVTLSLGQNFIKPKIGNSAEQVDSRKSIGRDVWR